QQPQPQPQPQNGAPAPAARELELDDGGPPTQAGPAPLPAVSEHAEPVLEDLQEKLHELGVDPGNYRIGEPTERGWAVEETSSGWRVGWYDGELTNPAVFGDAEDAAAFMLGKLLLAPDGSVPEQPTPQQPQQTQPPQAHQAQPQPNQERRPTPPAQQAPPPQQQPMLATLSPEVATGVRSGHSREPAAESPPQRPPAPTPPPAPATQVTPPVKPREPARPASQGNQGGSQQWPIQPLDGEPPLTLFRGKEMRELPAGSELDRFGGPSGNLTYAAGTPFEERSLVPEWVSRPYHVYRVQRPLEALAGVAIPWFNQPGGGAAYLLPASIEELLAEGDLIELEPGEPPVE
ncbi:TNT domain-containing protein, partial [Amycolatopsis cihanbeyliensis]